MTEKYTEQYTIIESTDRSAIIYVEINDIQIFLWSFSSR